MNVWQQGILAAAFIPYLIMGLYDGWMHGRVRHVSRTEQLLHALIAIAVSALVLGLFGEIPSLVLPSIALFVVIGMIDEFGFHRGIPIREWRVHLIAHLCFAVFLCIGVAMGAIRWPA